MENLSYNKTLNIYFSENHNYINNSLDEILILANLKDYKVSIRKAQYLGKNTIIQLAEVVIENNNQYFALSFYFDHLENNNQNIYLFNSGLYIYNNQLTNSTENIKNKLNKIKELL